MKRKALIIGALPSPFEGPWVKIGERKQWRVFPGGDYDGSVIIEIRVARQNYEGAWEIQRQRVVAGGLLSGAQARVVVEKEFPNSDTVSVIIEEVGE